MYDLDNNLQAVFFYALLCTKCKIILRDRQPPTSLEVSLLTESIISGSLNYFWRLLSTRYPVVSVLVIIPNCWQSGHGFFAVTQIISQKTGISVPPYWWGMTPSLKGV